MCPPYLILFRIISLEQRIALVCREDRETVHRSGGLKKLVNIRTFIFYANTVICMISWYENVVYFRYLCCNKYLNFFIGFSAPKKVVMYLSKSY